MLPLQRNRVYFFRNLAEAWFLLSSALIFFFLHWWEEVLLSLITVRRGTATCSSS